jgi:hypothetical protein
VQPLNSIDLSKLRPLVSDDPARANVKVGFPALVIAKTKALLTALRGSASVEIVTVEGCLPLKRELAIVFGHDPELGFRLAALLLFGLAALHPLASTRDGAITSA